MKMVRVFHEGVLRSEHLTWQRANTLPNGAYVLDADGSWFAIRFSAATSINLCDVPKELRLLNVLLT